MEVMRLERVFRAECGDRVLFLSVSLFPVVLRERTVR